jgi:integrase
MASIEERKNSEGETSYRVKVRLRGFPTQSATFERITDARKWIQDTESAIRNGRHFKTSKAKKHTVSELIDKYIKEVLDLKLSETQNQRHYLKWWKDEIGSYILADVNASLITEKRNILIGKENDYGRKIGLSTANRYTTTLGHVFTIAVNEWGWVEVNPVRKIKKLQEPRGRVRFLDDNERARLLEECKKSENPILYLVVVLALSTGARKDEILSLQWQDVDFERGVLTIQKTKNGERRVLPLKGYAEKLLMEHSKNRNAKSNYLFPSKNLQKPTDIRVSWQTAVKRANLVDFRFHDLRHSAASYLAMNGATLAEMAEVLGHKTLAMVKRYAHLTEAHTSSVVEKMNKKVFG